MKETTASKGSATSRRSPSATSKRAATDSRAARLLPSSISPAEITPPVTSKPSAASRHESEPSPQPSSSTRSPGRRRVPHSRTSAARRRMNSEGGAYSLADHPRESAVNLSAVAALPSVVMPRTSVAAPRTSVAAPQAHLGQLPRRPRLLLAAQLSEEAVPDFPAEQVVVVVHHEPVEAPVRQVRAASAAQRVEELRERQVLRVRQEHERATAERPNRRALHPGVRRLEGAALPGESRPAVVDEARLRQSLKRGLGHHEVPAAEALRLDAALAEPRAVARDALAHVAVAQVGALVRSLGHRADVEVCVLADLVAAPGQFFHASAHVASGGERAQRVDEEGYPQTPPFEFGERLLQATPDAVVVQVFGVQADGAERRHVVAPFTVAAPFAVPAPFPVAAPRAPRWNSSP